MKNNFLYLNAYRGHVVYINLNSVNCIKENLNYDPESEQDSEIVKARSMIEFCNGSIEYFDIDIDDIIKQIEFPYAVIGTKMQCSIEKIINDECAVVSIEGNALRFLELHKIRKI